jgi:hypothetical protein
LRLNVKGTYFCLGYYRRNAVYIYKFFL